jgi:hypothetical protein
VNQPRLSMAEICVSCLSAGESSLQNACTDQNTRPDNRLKHSQNKADLVFVPHGRQGT